MNATTQLQDAEKIAAWLEENPFFFDRFPNLASRLRLPRKDGAATSLAYYQIEVLREKNRELTRRLIELSTNAQNNELLALRIHQMTIILSQCTCAQDTVDAIAAAMLEDFEGDCIQGIFFTPLAGVKASWIRFIPSQDACLDVFKDCIVRGDPLCGRLTKEQNAVLYPKAEKMRTTALLPLPNLGLLAVGSHDPNRFYPGIGTLFLRMMIEVFTATLSRFHPKRANVGFEHCSATAPLGTHGS